MRFIPLIVALLAVVAASGTAKACGHGIVRLHGEIAAHFRSNFIPAADANNSIRQMPSWELHDVGKNQSR